MGKFWLKIWIWTKVFFAALLLIYLLAFVVMNHSNDARFWVWYDKVIITTSLTLAMAAFVAGLVAAFLIRTSLRTIRQLRDLQGRSQTQKTARQQEDAKSKAAMLRTKPAGSAGDKST